MTKRMNEPTIRRPSLPLTKNDIDDLEKIRTSSSERAALSDLHIVSPRLLFTRRLPEFLFIDEEARVADELLQLVHDVHGRWSGRLYYAKEAR